MRLLRTMVIMLAVAVLPMAAAAQGANVSPGSDECPEYGCTARLVALASGGLVLLGDARFPVTWFESPPGRMAHVILDGEVLQSIPIVWGSLDYFCCCPSELFGDYADLLSPIAKPGDILHVVVGSADICENVLEVPALITDPGAAAPAPNRGRTRAR